MREMKDSGFGWLGKVPANWKVERLQWHLYEINVKNSPIRTTNVLSLTNKRGVIPYEEKGAQGNISKENYNEYHLAYKDTIVANSMNILIGSVGYSDYYGCVSPVYYVFKEKEDNDLHFFNYIMQTTQFQRELRKYANGILEIRLRVSSDDILKRMIAVPEYSEQKKIANYLDDQCKKIDEIMADIQSQIDTLEDYKKSVISEAVTKGLDPDAVMKDSGISYIGKIPSSWKTDKGKFIFAYLEKPTRENDGVITCFRDGEVTLRSNRREDGFTISEKEIGYQGIDIGDLIVHGMDGFAGAIGISDSRGKASPVLNVLETTNNKRYYMYFLRNMAYRGVFVALATGIRVRTCDTNWGKLREIVYAIPPRDEQDKIAEYIDSRCAKIDSIIENKKTQLETVENYKKSLIYEYVTGKKEVPENE